MRKTLDPRAKVEVDGTIIEKLPDAKFRIKLLLEGSEHVIIGYVSGRMRMNYIKLNIGDKVKLEMTPYDLTKGRIIYRY